jgi:hypothetical protein
MDTLGSGELRYELRDGGFADYHAAIGDGSLCSERMRDLLEAARTEADLVTWEHAVVAAADGEKRVYYLLQIAGTPEVIHRELTTWVPGTDHVIRVTLDTPKAREHSIFAYESRAGTPIATRRIKALLEKERMTGIEFASVPQSPEGAAPATEPKLSPPVTKPKPESASAITAPPIDDIYARLDSLREPIRARDWQTLWGLRERFVAESQPSIATEIARLDLDGYREAIAAMLERASRKWKGSQGAAYWEFNPEDRWSSHLFLCNSYNDEAEQDDDWASDFDEGSVEEGPAAPALARLYEPAWDSTRGIAARNLALIAITLEVVALVADRSWRLPIPLCAGYHDQDVVFRIMVP